MRFTAASLIFSGKQKRRISTKCERSSPPINWSAKRWCCCRRCLQPGSALNIGGIAEEEQALTEQFLSDTAPVSLEFSNGRIVARARAARSKSSRAILTQRRADRRATAIAAIHLGGESDNYLAGQEIVVVPWPRFFTRAICLLRPSVSELFRRRCGGAPI